MEQPVAERADYGMVPEGGNVGPYTFDEYVGLAKSFHSYPAPGLLLGGFMVAEAQRRMPAGVLYDAVCETSWCLPDAVQLLTPCTIGNGWLRIMDLGLYALALFDKQRGEGVRVAVDPARLADWGHITAWLFKTAPKREQDSDALRESIRRAGASICKVEPVRVRENLLRHRSKGDIVSCPLCGEAYPRRFGSICRRCQGEGPYAGVDAGVAEALPAAGSLRALPVEQSLGKVLLHDMTQIIPGESKDAVFRRGQVVSAGDVCRLQQMGRFHVYAEQEAPEGMLHEDDVAKSFGEVMAGDGVVLDKEAKEGKMNLLAGRDGLLTVDETLLESFNLLPGVMAASRCHCSTVRKGRVVAATRAIPLFLERRIFDQAMRVLQDGPLFTVRELRKARAGLVVTGNEVFKGLIQDRFAPVITGKLEQYGCTLVGKHVAPDDADAIAQAVQDLADAGADLLITTAGLSVDPDDVTRKGLIQAGVGDIRYGIPVLPGAMTLIGQRGGMQVLGVPACALFHKTTSLDVLLPRLLAGMDLSRSVLAKLGPGGLCRQCTTCVYPKCAFGK